MNLVNVISTKIGNGGRMLIKVLRMGKTDVQEKYQVYPFGFDSNPLKDLVALYAPTGEKGKEVIIGYVNKDLITDVGESRIFSTDESGELKMFLHLKNDGTAEFGGNIDNMVRFSQLEAAFDTLKYDHNALVNAFNTHTHATAAPGPPVPPTPIPSVVPAVISTADISGAKIDEIKTL
jgi:hypothetical protein